jgi:hypothetical protein
VGPETVQSPILQYLVAALKEVLSRPEFDESIVQLYTFTEVVQAYDFGGAEVRCVVLDRTIKSDENARIVLPVLKDCRVQPSICRINSFGCLTNLRNSVGTANCGAAASGTA